MQRLQQVAICLPMILGVSKLYVTEYAMVRATCLANRILLFFFFTFSFSLGYRYIRISLFIEGVAVGSFVTYTVCGFYTGLLFPGLLGVSLFVGVAFAVVSVLILNFGLFLSGFTMGFFTGLALLMAVSPLYTLSIKWIPFGILLGFSLLFALLILKFKKSLVIGSTAMFGGVLASVGVDFYVEKFLLLTYAWNRIIADKSTGDSCWFSWIILAIWPLIFIVGFIIQFRITGRHVDHKGKGMI